MVNFSSILGSTKSNPAKAVCLSAVLVFFASSIAFADDGISCKDLKGISVPLQETGGQGGAQPKYVAYVGSGVTVQDISCNKNGRPITIKPKSTSEGSSSSEFWFGGMLIGIFDVQPRS